MTVRDGEDPALPEVSPDEAWYDAEIAPALAALATRCHARGMLVARLENMQKNGDTWLTVQAVLALLNDCDMLAARERA